MWVAEFEARGHVRAGATSRRYKYRSSGCNRVAPLTVSMELRPRNPIVVLSLVDGIVSFEYYLLVEPMDWIVQR